MSRAVLALVLGGALYVAVLAMTPRGKLLDADYWADHREIAVIGVVALCGLAMWTAISLPPGATLDELLEEMFRRRGYRARRDGWLPYALIGSIPFALLSTGHLVLIDIRKRLVSSDA
jgi:hypothetical protein